ncbi:MAG: SDR family oxidoreductase [Xanthomonadales bacterium]|nr:SDR family oxidoreductase [Xanthomonadales bacterium]
MANPEPLQALVTGANRGLGLALTRQLLEAGHRVIGACRQPGRAAELNHLSGDFPGHLRVLPLDLSSDASIGELAKEAALVAGPIDLLVNNAGILHAGERFGRLASTHLADSFRSNAAAPLLLAQALSPQLAEGARIANISSQLGSIANTGRFRTPSYAVSKAAQNMATRLLAAELAPRDIIVLALHPGWVRTDMGGDNADISADEAAAGLLRVIASAGPADSGHFLDWRGEPLPW